MKLEYERSHSHFTIVACNGKWFACPFNKLIQKHIQAQSGKNKTIIAETVFFVFISCGATTSIQYVKVKTSFVI